MSALGAVAARDLLQRELTLLRNVPVIGHGRYLAEAIGPEGGTGAAPLIFTDPSAGRNHADNTRPSNHTE